jgi:hypothetical protein
VKKLGKAIEKAKKANTKINPDFIKMYEILKRE